MARRIRGATSDTFRSFRIRNFRLFFGGQFISQVGNWMTLTAQTLLVLHLTGSGVAIGVLVAFQFAPVLLFGAWAGLIADRLDKRRLLLVVQAFALLQSATLATLAFSGVDQVWAYDVVAFFGGLATAFDNPARRAFVVEMVPEHDVPNAVSLNSALMTSSRIFGPALAGLVARTWGYGWSFTIDAVSYLAVLAGLWLIDPAKLRRPPVTPRERGQIRQGLRYVRGVPDLWVPLVMMTLVGTLAFNFTVVLPLFVEHTFDGDDATFTLLFSVLSVGSLLAALAGARREVVELRHLAAAAAAFGASMLLLAASPSLTFAFPIAVAVGASSISFMVTSTSIVQIRADPAMRGRVLALQAMVFLGSTPIGGPILGWICQQWGARAGLSLGGVACLAAAVIGWRASRRSPAAAPAMASDDEVVGPMPDDDIPALRPA